MSFDFRVLSSGSVDVMRQLFVFWLLLFLHFIRTYFVGRVIYVIFALY